jgi:hypothetical protein
MPEAVRVFLAYLSCCAFLSSAICALATVA